MKSTTLVALALLVAGCGNSKDQGGADKTPAKRGSSESAAPTAKTTKDLFGAKPGLPAVIGKLQLGMTRAEATAAAPDVLGAKYGYKVPDYKGVEVSVDFSDKTDRVRAIRVRLPDSLAEVKTMLASWGEPRGIKISTGDMNYYWHDLEAGLRIEGEPIATASQLIFSDALGLARYLGTDPKHFGWELKPLLGMAKDDVMTTYARWTVMPGSEPDTIQFSPPSSEVSEFSGSIVAKLAGGKVVAYNLDLNWEWDPAAKDKVMARLEQLFGKSKPASVDLYVDYPGPPRVKAEHRATSTHLWVGDKK